RPQTGEPGLTVQSFVDVAAGSSTGHSGGGRGVEGARQRSGAAAMAGLPRAWTWIDDCSTSWKCAAASNAVFWPLSALGLCADALAATSPSSWPARQKLQPDRRLSPRDRTDLISLAAFNMLVVAPFLCCPIFEILWDRIQGSDRLTEADEWRWREELLLKLPLHALVAEVAFYLVHVLLHRSQFLYRTVHKVHHRFVAPTAMACVYAHPLEFAAGNIFPIYLGCMLTNAHPVTCYGIWFPLAMAGTCKGH
ncbi:hypothetical protein ACHAWF_004775, partial [Thalassiosira exigua]